MLPERDDPVEDIFDDEEFVYEDYDNTYPETDTDPEPNPVEKQPYNEWRQEVSKCIETLTMHAHNIYTVGFENWWRDWWLEGKTPEEAASQGLNEEILSEDE